MTDSSRDPGWAPPGDASDPAAPDQPPREETVRFSTEATQRIARDEPPPPPPPPSATGGWAPPPHPGAERSYGPGGWQPPPRPRRRTGLVVGVVIGVVALVVLLGAGAVLLVRSVDGQVAFGGDVEVERVPGEDPGVAEDVPADDLEAQAGAILRTINESEERMIAFQQAVFDGVGEDGTVGDAAAEIAEAAQDAGDDLTGLRSDLRALAGGEADGFDGLRDIRDTYASHMDAWIDYLDAVAGSPALAAPDSADAEPLWRDIETTGDDFVGAVETGLPDRLPPDLEQLARFIVERGFGGFDDGPPGEVV